jgi:hypothetical protein
MQWMKDIYLTFGAPHPRISLVVVFILAGTLAAGAWHFLGKQVEKDRQIPIALPVEIGPAVTSGDNSPAISGNGNSVTYDQSSHHEKEHKNGK